MVLNCYLKILTIIDEIFIFLSALQTLIPKIKKPGILTIPVPTPDSPVRNWSLAQPSFVLTISTALLVTLFLSAGFLLYRISKIQNTFYDFPLMPTR